MKIAWRRSQDEMNCNDFKGSTCRQVEVPSRQLAGGSEGNHEKYHTDSSRTTLPRFEPGMPRNNVGAERIDRHDHLAGSIADGGVRPCFREINCPSSDK